MSIPVTCSACGSKMSAPDHALGKKGKCPKCNAPILVQPANEHSRWGVKPETQDQGERSAASTSSVTHNQTLVPTALSNHLHLVLVLGVLMVVGIVLTIAVTMSGRGGPPPSSGKSTESNGDSLASLTQSWKKFVQDAKARTDEAERSWQMEMGARAKLDIVFKTDDIQQSPSLQYPVVGVMKFTVVEYYGPGSAVSSDYTLRFGYAGGRWKCYEGKAIKRFNAEEKANEHELGSLDRQYLRVMFGEK